jgi:hypothetical protein
VIIEKRTTTGVGFIQQPRSTGRFGNNSVSREPVAIQSASYHRLMAKALSRNEIRARATKFAHDWHGETRERAEAQTFWNEFLEIFGVNRRQVSTFERRATRLSTGRGGSVDLFWPGVLIAEHKSAGKDLAAAEEQAFDYLYDRKSINQNELPRFVITSDFAHMRIIELGKLDEAVVFDTLDLPKEIDRFLFIAGYDVRPHAVEAEANIRAAQLMGRLYEEISANGYEGHDASVLLTRILFLLFGDDTGMWNRDLFYFFLDERTSDDGSDLGPQLSLLFQILNQPVEKRSIALDEALVPFPFVNGGLFFDRIEIPIFNRAMREELLACCHFDWGRISPAVFGSLFQSIKSKEARRELGEHYTTEENILRVIEPLFLSDLRSELVAAQSDIRRLERLRDRLGRLRLFDPAMGCGNFVVVAYRELRRLELRIMVRLRELTGQNQLSLDPTLGIKVSMDHFGGIEIEEWPARIAETAMFLVDHQCNLELSVEFGQAPERLPIETSARFFCANALQLDWGQVFESSDDVLICGNPPFVGSTYLSDEQKQDQRTIWGGISGSGVLDYVSNWYLVAAKYIGESMARAAFVSTSSITQGQQPSILWGHRGLGQFETGIVFAHRTFSWSSEAPREASVHCVVIGIANRGIPKLKLLWEYSDVKQDGVLRSVRNINAYLLDAPWVIVSSRSRALSIGVSEMVNGSKPTDGGFLSNLTPEEAEEIQRNDSIASKYLRKVVGSQELIQGIERWCLWLVNAPPGDIASSSVLSERVDAVRKGRASSKKAATRRDAATPSLFQELRQPTSQFLAVPEVSSETRKYVPIGFFPPTVVPTNKIQTIPNATAYDFGVLSSSVFNVWLAVVSGRLESRFSVSAEITYNNFPWPEVNDKSRSKISKAAEGVLAVRMQFPDSPLAILYSPISMPPDLVDAHRTLDRQVASAYALRSDATSERILEELFERYARLSGSAVLFEE